MSFFDDRGDRGDLGPPPEPFRFNRGGDRSQSPLPLKWIGVAAAILVTFIVLNTLKSIYVDYLWFDSVEFSSVYSTVITWKILLFFVGFIISAAIIGANIMIARRFAPSGLEESFIEEVDVDAIRRIVTVLLIAATLFMAVIFGSVTGGAWETILAWRNAVEFGWTDPQFNRDASFYVFTLPAYDFIQSWLLGVVIISALGAGAVYGLALSLQRFEWRITPAMRVHLSILGGLALLIIAIGTWIGIYSLVNSPLGIIYGGAYTDINARLPVRYILTGLAAAAGLVTIANAFLTRDSFRLPVFVIGVWVFVGFVGGVIYPNFVQNFQVDPNELQRERQYISRNIEATRYGFGLDQIQEADYPANPAVTEQEIANNPETIRNIRLLDPVPLRDTIIQLQAIRQFYTFADIDVDRYMIDGQIQQVMIAARELNLSQVVDRNWTRERLQLTHGFGAVVTPVNEVGPEGLPLLLTSDIPPRGEEVPVTVEGARIYFGELTNHYVIANSDEPEFDYPLGEGNAETFYAEDRGIRLDSLLKRAVIAWELGDQNILISGQINPDSRLLMNRNIRQRVREVAPFLQLDADPYLVVQNGALMWVQPAYTIARSFPYSQPIGGVNYIRHSVTVTISAQTGDMTFYRMDVEDAVADTWASIFPDLMQPAGAMPESIKVHLRYPLDLFKIQSNRYLRYHITNPDVWFLGEDVWNIPTERVANEDSPVEPYYVVMKLPTGTGREIVSETVEFVLIMPFTPRNRQNTVAWLAGRADGDAFGELRAYRFPTDALVFGPAQIEARIDQNQLISQQLSLWDQAGSSVIRGNLLMIPIGESFLYVEPIYLQARNSRIPELVRVVVANGNQIVMEPTLDRAIDVLLGRRSPTPLGGVTGDGTPIIPTDPTVPTDPGTPVVTPIPTGTPVPTATPTIPMGDLQALFEQADAAFQSTQDDLQRLREILEAIRQELANQ